MGPVTRRRAGTPVLFISGTLDGRTYAAEASEALRGQHNGRHLIIENGGHDIFEADPRVADAVVAFLDDRPVPEVIRLDPPVFARP
jgi:pimeloyl-ACP methyl ester carboxylesterase